MTLGKCYMCSLSGLCQTPQVKKTPASQI
uniref:Uncharacterized protein n=1 Tax=Anguilla anguilla TaxID=7936 RepID=A0A0E9SBZ5_ANGAN